MKQLKTVPRLLYVIIVLIILIIIAVFLRVDSKQKLAEATVKGCVAKRTEVIIKDQSVYAKGSLLVGFNDISFDEAKTVLMQLKLKHNENANFSANKYLVITVPQGEELEWACKLEMNSQVKYVELNYLRKAITR